MKKYNYKTNIPYILSHILTSLFICGLFFTPIKTYALNENYLAEAYWNKSDNITNIALNKSYKNHNLNGFYKYYVDDTEKCIYTYFSISESSIDQNNTDVRITYNIKNNGGEVNFSVNGTGIVATATTNSFNYDINDLIICEQSFHTSPKTKNGYYISCLQLNDNILEKYNNNIEVFLYVNGHIYEIDNSINLTSNAKTTTKKPTTEANTKDSESKATKANSNTKFYYSGDSDSNINDNSNDNNKYSYSTEKFDGDTDYDDDSNEGNQYSDDNTTAISQNYADNKSLYKMSNSSKIVTGVAGTMAGTGILALTVALFSKPKSLKLKPENDSDNY